LGFELSALSKKDYGQRTTDNGLFSNELSALSKKDYVQQTTDNGLFSNELSAVSDERHALHF
jgi:hypothetical protein